MTASDKQVVCGLRITRETAKVLPIDTPAVDYALPFADVVVALPPRDSRPLTVRCGDTGAEARGAEATGAEARGAVATGAEARGADGRVRVRVSDAMVPAAVAAGAARGMLRSKQRLSGSKTRVSAI